MSRARKNNDGKTNGATSKKRKNSKNKNDSICHGRRMWENLPVELLDIIFNKNNSRMLDYLRFGQVCRSWRLCCLEFKQRYFESHSPLAVHISIRATRRPRPCYFYDFATRIRYKTKLLNFAENVFLGISSGYLIMKQLCNTFLLLVNPFTGHQLQVPCMPESNPTCSSDRAIFASVGSDHDLDFLVVVLSRVHLNLQFCKLRDNQWKEYSFADKRWIVIDIIVFDGKIFAITSDSQIGILNLKSSELVLLNLKSSPRLRDFVVKLVASNEQLFVVIFCRAEVYRIDFSGMEWVRVNNLGDQALFLGDKMSSRSINPTKWEGRSNCLYYLQNNSSLCLMRSVDGKLVHYLPIGKGCFAPQINCWYFLDQSNIIDNVKDV